MAGLLKKVQTTGLVGLAVSQNPHERLKILYSKILASLQTMPQDAAYRKYTEQLVNERFNHIKTMRWEHSTSSPATMDRSSWVTPEPRTCWVISV
ncbi:NADH dehydrogenase [ubiquinone] 1 alpha subcomplex subunit 5 isoform X3 [Chaetodon auriga]|uniref:NADH dehydrogenase [ubiquinone] 1 alpha subcomplex subunit 5 isoform X3 n=1 Tax=Chaetodon auriga TaxID=39042 RepID=UPI004032E9D1